MSESFTAPAAQRQAEREIEAFRRYRQLERTFVEVNEKICRVRPVEDTFSTEEKNDRSDPDRDRARSNDTAGPRFRRTEAERRPGSGSGGDGLSRRHASGRSGGSHSVFAIPRAGAGTAQHPVVPGICVGIVIAASSPPMNTWM